MTDLVIEANSLTKKFGSRTAISDVTLHVPRGTCVGFLGPNGAGKTTMMRMILGLARPTSGTVNVRGFDVQRDLRKALHRVSGIVEEPRFYPYLSARDNLRVFAGFLGGKAHDRIDESLDAVGLRERREDQVKGFSLGMRTRLGVARTLLNDPELLVLDEPTNGLDAAGMADFRVLTRRLIEEKGCTIMISSHLLDEMEKIVDYVSIVTRGRVILEGSLDELIKSGQRGLDIECDNVELAIRTLATVPEIENIQPVGDRGVYASIAAGPELRAAINAKLVSAGIGVSRLNPREETLEQRYFDITKYAEEQSAGAP